MDETEMASCPTKSEYTSLKGKSSPSDDEKERIGLYKQNKRIMATMVLGQTSDQGIAMIENTKSDDSPADLPSR